MHLHRPSITPQMSDWWFKHMLWQTRLTACGLTKLQETLSKKSSSTSWAAWVCASKIPISAAESCLCWHNASHLDPTTSSCKQWKPSMSRAVSKPCFYLLNGVQSCNFNLCSATHVYKCIDALVAIEDKPLHSEWLREWQQTWSCWVEKEFQRSESSMECNVPCILCSARRLSALASSIPGSSAIIKLSNAAASEIWVIRSRNWSIVRCSSLRPCRGRW